MYFLFLYITCLSYAHIIIITITTMYTYWSDCMQ